MGNISLVKVGGVCAILVVVSGIMARIVFGNAWLASRGVDTLITGHWFDVLALLLSMPAALGFYRALDEASAVLRIAVTAFVTGTIFLLFHEFVRLGIGYELVVPDTLVQIGWLAAGVGYILIYGIAPKNSPKLPINWAVSVNVMISLQRLMRGGYTRDSKMHSLICGNTAAVPTAPCRR